MDVEISVIVPVFNEAENLLLLYKNVIQVLDKIGDSSEIIYINDGSTDGSREIIDSIAQNDPRVKIVHFRRNFGQTAAMMAGFDYAAGNIIIPLDADLQNDPEDIPRLIAKLEEGYDVVSGWRKNRKDHALKRNFVSMIANRMISIISGVHLHDYGCSLKAYRKDVIKGVKLYGEMHRFIPIYASWFGARIAEIPVSHHSRRFGNSKYGLERVMKVIFDMLVVKFLARYSNKPMYIFGGVGVTSIFIAFLSGLLAIYFKVFDNTSFIQTPLPLLVVLMTITGIMCFLMGLLSEIVIRTYYESQGKTTYLVAETRNFNSQ